MSKHGSDDLRNLAIVAEAERLRLEMAKMASEQPGRKERIDHYLRKALRGQPVVLSMAALADALSAGLTGMSADDRAAAMMAFCSATLEMAAIRDAGIH